MKKTILTLCAGLFSLASIIPIHASAQTTANSQSAANDVPRVISYQAAITDATGNALPDGIYTIGAALYNVAGDRTIWRNTYHVEARNGIVNLLLGSGSVALPDFSQAGAVWLGIRINGDEELPLTQFTGAPYALTVPNGAITTPKIANNAITAEKMGVDYVGSLSVNGQKVSGKGGDINIVTDGIDATVDPGSSSVILRNGSGSSAIGTKGSGAQGNSTVTGTLTVTGSTLLNTAGGTTTINSLAASQPVKTDANKVLISGAMNLANSNDVAGTLPIANGGTGATTPSGALNALGAALATRTISTGSGLSGGGNLSADRTISLANTAVTPGSYAAANITVDEQGRITEASSGAGNYVQNGPVFQVASFNITGIGEMGYFITHDGSADHMTIRDISFPYSVQGESPFTLDLLGPVHMNSDATLWLPGTSGTLLTDTRTVSTGTGLTGGGDLSADRTISLANTTVTVGSYTNANITVDAQGRLTAAANGSGGSGGLSHITETYINTTPFGFGTAAEQLLANGTDATISLALQPKGSGALEAQIADNTATGGNRRGVHAVDWQMVRSANTQVASGPNATVGGGGYNTASGVESTVGGGDNNTASGYSATVGGGVIDTASGYSATVGGGLGNTASGFIATISGGMYANASQYGQHAQASGDFASVGDAQTSVFTARNSTTNATATDLYLDGEATSIVVPASGAMNFHVSIIGKTSGSPATVGAWDVNGAIYNNGGTAEIVGTNVTTLYSNAGGWGTPIVTASGANLIIYVRGAASTNIRWVARVETAEITY